MSTVQIFLAAAGMLISVSIAIVGFFLSGHRERNRAFKQACGGFRTAFSDTLAELGAANKDVHYLMSKAKVRHEAAIDDFWRHLRPLDVSGFDVARQKYRTCRDSAQPAILHAMRAQATGQPVQDDDAVRNEVNSTSKCNIADGPSGQAAVASWLFRPASRRKTDEALHAAHPGATIPD